VMELRTPLTSRPAQASLQTLLGLWMIVALLLPMTPALAQDSQPDTKEQPASSTEESAQPSPTPQGDAQTAPATPGTPAPVAKEGSSASASLEELLQEEVPTASVGSFGYRLRRYGIHPYIHGALAVDLWKWREEEGDPAYQGFDLRDAHLYFGADILDLIVPELFMELESNDPGVSELFLRYAQLDVRLAEQHLVMRAGLFLVPFGTYNTEVFPRFISKLPDRPGYFNELVPVAWREVGVQAFGKWEWKPGLSLSYAVYVTNGMQQPDPDGPDDGVAEGGSIADLENVFEETSNTSKSVGAHVRMEALPGLAIGLSGYTGPYTLNGKRQLSLAGMDLSFHRGKLSLELESAVARQEVTGGALTKWGYYALAAYRVHSVVEPVLAIDEFHLDGDPEDDGRTFWVAANVFPFPDQIPNAQFKLSYGNTFYRNGVSQSRFTFQFAVGF
jgi:hypothetical protein